jgi:hypothetical protein
MSARYFRPMSSIVEAPMAILAVLFLWSVAATIVVLFVAGGTRKRGPDIARPANGMRASPTVQVR